jgi:hypothetical protein
MGAEAIQKGPAMAKTKKRATVRSIKLDINARCQRIYPIEGSLKSVPNLESVGLKLNKAQAIILARLLLVASQDWDEIAVTAYRKDRRNTDGTYPITVTSPIK